MISQETVQFIIMYEYISIHIYLFFPLLSTAECLRYITELLCFINWVMKGSGSAAYVAR